VDAGSREELLALARTTLSHYLSAGKIPDYTPRSDFLRERCGAFVSLHRGNELRGCIGQITADRELYRIVQHCAVAAGTTDDRFYSVSGEELPELTFEVSVLTPLRVISDLSEIEVGRHGLMVTLGRRRGLLLPQVATEYGWNRECFLARTCEKAGLRPDAWRDPSIRIEVFEADVVSE
jgi:AmmeMemoRadiSam system protein A